MGNFLRGTPAFVVESVELFVRQAAAMRTFVLVTHFCGPTSFVPPTEAEDRLVAALVHTTGARLFDTRHFRNEVHSADAAANHPLGSMEADVAGMERVASAFLAAARCTGGCVLLAGDDELATHAALTALRTDPQLHRVFSVHDTVFTEQHARQLFGVLPRVPRSAPSLALRVAGCRNAAQGLVAVHRVTGVPRLFALPFAGTAPPPTAAEVGVDGLLRLACSLAPAQTTLVVPCGTVEPDAWFRVVRAGAGKPGVAALDPRAAPPAVTDAVTEALLAGADVLVVMGTSALDDGLIERACAVANCEPRAMPRATWCVPDDVAGLVWPA